MGWTAPPTFTSHAVLSSANLSIISNDLAFLGAVPIGEAYTVIGDTIVAAASSPTQIAMGYAWNSGGMAFAANQFTVPVAGKYLVFGQVIYNVGTTGATYWGAQIYQNGTAVATGEANTSVAPSVLTVDVEYLLICAASDTVALYGIQSNPSSSYTAEGTLGIFWVSN